MRGFVTLFIFLTAVLQAPSHAQRLLGLDISAWQGNISQSTWNNIHNVENREFVFIRSTRGGTTGFYNQSDPNNNAGNNTLSHRYDDPYFVQNINRATTAGIYAGPYHFSRPDIIESTPNSGGIRNTGADEADHFIQMAGPWMRPGYLVPIHDLEAGDGIRTDNEMAQFAVDFSNRIFQRMGIRPGIYINGNYAANILQPASQALRDQLARPAAGSASAPSVFAPAYPVLWVARWPNQADPNSINIQGTDPKDTYPGFYGPWDDYGDRNPWDFWQYASTARLPSFNNGANNLDVNVLHGDIEYLKDQLVPAVWITDTSGDWSTLANWNSGQTPVAPVPGPGQVTPIGTQTLPTPRLPGATGTGVTSGRHDTVILERTNANITVTLSTGTHNLRKLYLREALNITGGSLTINYDPTYASNPAFPNTARSGPISAQFSGPVTLSGGSLTVHTLQVDPARTFTVSGGALTLNTISLMRGPTPAKIVLGGDVTINALGSDTASITSGNGLGDRGSIDLAANVTTLTISDSPAEIDFSVDVSIFGGAPGTNRALVKAGPGTMRLTRDNGIFGGTTISAGRLFINNPLASGSGAGLQDVMVNDGVLGGTGNIIGEVTVHPAGTIAPGDITSIGTLTLWNQPTLNGTTLLRINRNGGSRSADKLYNVSGFLIYGGALVVTNIGAPLLGDEAFKLFDSSSYGGTFTNIILPPLSAGLNWYTDTLRTTGSILVNRAPVATPITLTNYPPDVLAIHLSTLLATVFDDNSHRVASINLVTTNGITLTTNDTHIFYVNNLPVPDKFTYTIADNRGGSTTNTVHITNDGSARFASAPTLNANGLTLNFVGRPGSTYHLDRSTNLLDWITISTIVAPANGLFQYFDPNSLDPAAFYQLRTSD